MKHLDQRTLSAPTGGGTAPAGTAVRIERTAPAGTFATSKAYAAGWLMIGAGAFSYLVALGFMPELVGAARPGTAEQTGEGLSREVAVLKEAVSTLTGELAELKGSLAQVDERERSLVRRLAAVEAKSEPGAAAVPANAPRTVPRAKVVATTPKADPAAAPKSAARIETGSIETAPAAGGDPARSLTPPALPPDWRSSTRLLNADPQLPATPAVPGGKSSGDKAASVDQGGPVGIQLATGPSVESLRLSWSLLNDRHRGVLRSLEPRAATSGDGTAYQLVAGPIATDADAQRICAELHTKGVACRPTAFGGSGL